MRSSVSILEKRVLDLCGRAGLRSFFPDSRLLLEAYVYTVAVVSQRFRTLEALKQVKMCIRDSRNITDGDLIQRLLQ